MFNVKGKRAIVTGGAGGIGQALVRRLLLSSCSVCIADMNQSLGQQILKQLQDEFGFDNSRVCFVQCDVTSRDSWIELWSKAEHFLGGSIDVLCNNAGIGYFPGNPEKTLLVNTVGVAIGLYYALEKMGKTKGGNGGRILNTASIASFNINESYSVEQGTYPASKTAVACLTRAFGLTFSDPASTDDVKCYALAPGFTETVIVDNLLSNMGTIRGKTFKNKEQIIAGGISLMKPSDIADAMMVAFEKDRNGSILCIINDGCLVEYPYLGNLIFQYHVVLAMGLKRIFNISYLAPWQSIAIFLVVLWIIFTVAKVVMSALI